MNPIINTLPYDSRIEYLESTGSQYIDTGINGGTTAGYEIVFSLSSTQSVNFAHICGSSQDETTISKIFINGAAGKDVICDWFNGSTRGSQTLFSYSTNQHYVKILNGTITADNSTYSTNNVGFGSRNFCLFGYTAEPNLKSKMRLYSCKVYKNGGLVRDLIPVRVGQVGYLYDKVSGQLFGNAGTGSFTLGNDVYPSFIKGIGSAAQSFAVGSSEVEAMYIGETKIYEKLYDARIDYLESTGTQWIDTGIAMGSDVGASMQFAMTVNVQGDYNLLGVGDDRFRWGFGIYINSSKTNHIQTAGLAYQGNSWQNYQCSSLTTYNILYNYSNDKKVFLNGTSIRTGLPTGNLNNGNIYMFGFNYGGDSGSYEGKGTLWRGVKAKIYSCQITKNGVVVRDFIPVRVGQVGYMYDKVSKQLFGNTGTGNFTLGPDV